MEQKKTRFSLFTILFTLLFFSTLLSNHNTDTTTTSNKNPNFTTFRTTSPAPSNVSDWSILCSAPKSYRPRAAAAVAKKEQRQQRSTDGCDLFSGKWIYDPETRPLYNEAGCPWMSDQLACTKHGRPDTDYQRWHWQPHGCNLKRWNALEMLNKLRGKRLMFVGDSLNRGQWISMVCLLQSVIPADKKSMSPNAALTTFKAQEYNATVEFYWAPLLVESNSDDPVNHHLDDRIIRPGIALKHASQWEGADILIFNSYLWWRSGPKIKLLWNSGDSICEEADGPDAMHLALKTWEDWVASHVNPLKQRLFFVTMSPTHLWSREWSSGTEGNCFQEKSPIDAENYWGSGSDLATMRLVDDVLGRLGSKVQVVNITQLSEYRKDGHPSIYRKFWETFSPQQLANPVSYADCIHWCLPGVPDVWNELIFNLL